MALGPKSAGSVVVAHWVHGIPSFIFSLFKLFVFLDLK